MQPTKSAKFTEVKSRREKRTLLDTGSASTSSKSSNPFKALEGLQDDHNTEMENQGCQEENISDSQLEMPTFPKSPVIITTTQPLGTPSPHMKTNMENYQTLFGTEGLGRRADVQDAEMDSAEARGIKGSPQAEGLYSQQMEQI
ncbi:hypothetical protein R1sor_019291 [Riccia sorocarpa]|uniref:Uncharacterized protein n=1 Tax=Riccia sorocarpa TaxID=122646 RepID=A0ABD3IIB2_9MARC